VACSPNAAGEVLSYASQRLQSFSGELSVAFPGIERLNLSPVYLCQKILVCLDCGYTELVISGAGLEKLRKGMEGSSRSMGA
jgi:hypothetical protein